jgi:hypothetical protein
MSRALLTGFVGVALATILGLLIACSAEDSGGSGDDSGDDDSCIGDNEPELLSVTVIVNGVSVETPATIQPTDQLELAIEYNDADCNLDGGSAALYSPNEDTLIDLPDISFEGLGCSSAEAGGPFVFSLNAMYFGGATAPYGLEVFDACGLASNAITLEITSALE